MTQLNFNQPAIHVWGPFWTAFVRIVQIEQPAHHWGFRSLFVSNTPVNAFDTSKLLLPNSFLLLVRVETAVIYPNNKNQYTWQKADNSQPLKNLNLEQIEQGLSNGKLALLLVNADLYNLRRQSADNPFPTLQCLGGMIRLDVMTPKQVSKQVTDETRLYKMLGLEKAGTDSTQPFYLHASGLTLYGQRALPWDNTPISAPFVVTREYSDGEPQSRFRLSIDEPLINSFEKQALITSWQTFHQLLNPGYPSQIVKEKVDDTPAWATLEAVNPYTIPRMHWPINGWNEARPASQIQFDPETFNLILSDASPYDPDKPPLTLTRIILDELLLDKEGEQLTLKISSDSTSQLTSGKWEYRGQKQGNTWKEEVEIDDLHLTLQAPGIASFLRDIEEESIPEWVKGYPALEKPILWGTMPIDGGWLQFPFLNLTEQLYIESEIVQFQSEDREQQDKVMRGALSLGNRQAREYIAENKENPWDIVLSNYASLTGIWEIDLTKMSLVSIEMSIDAPNLVLNGFLWLSTTKPTLEDGLPNLFDWPKALTPFPLKTELVENMIFPSPLSIHLPSLSLVRQQQTRTSTLKENQSDNGNVDSAQTNESNQQSLVWPQLMNWSLTIMTQTDVFQQFIDAGLLPNDTYTKYLPLIWRRHPTLPVIQALSLTENQIIPQYPSPNRALAPNEPTIQDNWRIGVLDGAGAQQWANYIGDIVPASEWATTTDLPFVYLSMPGLVGKPSSTDNLEIIDHLTGHTLNWRYDIPLTDQVYALTKLPKEAQQEKTPSVSGEPEKEQPHLPLNRQTFGAYWQTLSEKSGLARVDNDSAIVQVDDQTVIRYLIEPFDWPVDLTIDTNVYPGEIVIKNAHDNAAPLSLAGNDLLKGISGSFRVSENQLQRVGSTQPTNGNTPIQVTAGSMAAYSENSRYRDQRGLWRGATKTEPLLLQTAVSLEETQTNWELTTTRESIPLNTQGGDRWLFWMKNVPFLENAFERELLQSDLNEDINDPESLSRTYNFLKGYEWRLGHVEELQKPLSLFGLLFFPLSLEKVAFNAGSIRTVTIKGRLQLPVANHLTELETGQSVVRLHFTQDEKGQLILQTVEAVSEKIEWPLRIEGGESVNAPYLVWETAVIETTPSGATLRIVDPFLQVYLFDYFWRIPLSGGLDFPFEPATAQETFIIPSGADPSPIKAKSIHLMLNMMNYQHSCRMEIALVVGGVGKNGLDLIVHYNLLKLENKTNSAPTTIGECRLFEDVTAVNATITGNEKIWEIVWQTGEIDPPSKVELLPGMTAQPGKLPGFAIFTFAATSQSNQSAANISIPTLQLTSGFLELLLSCQWGAFLQQGETEKAQREDVVFQSSAGDLVLAYTASWESGSNWQETYLLNGMLEVNNLISWPLDMNLNESEGHITIPHWSPGIPLNHIRHTIRILFNQHQIPLEIIKTEAGGTILEFAPDKSWQFLAVVEHQLIDVSTSPDLHTITITNDRRWTTLQEIRLLPITTFINSIQRTEQTIGDDGKTAPLSKEYGYYQSHFQAALLEQIAIMSDPDSNAFLFVEASAPHWIRQTPIGDNIVGDQSIKPSTPLQYLPSGSQLALLSQLEDYTLVGSKTTDDWLLLVMPFLGRLQSTEYDSFQSEVDTPQTPFQIDPIRHIWQSNELGKTSPALAFIFASRSAKANEQIPISPFDLASLRTFARLDIASLEENWYRLQNPRAENIPSTLQSIIATFPNTPSRLSRSTALRQIFDSMRPSYPPISSSADMLPIDLTTSAMVWREGHLLLFQGSTSNGNAPYAWHITGAQIHSSRRLLPKQSSKQQRFPAATLIPIQQRRDGTPNRLPVSFAVSPYAGLEFLPAPEEKDKKLHLVSVELLCLTEQNQLKPMTSILREIETDPGKLFREETYEQFARNWGWEMHKRLTPDAAVAALRLRKILRNVSEENENEANNQKEAVLVTDYDYLILSNVERPARLMQRSFKLRPPVDDLTFREGQFGGYDPPCSAEAFELAPPQTTGVQPIHLEMRPNPGSAWPWGYSAMQVASRITKHSKGVVGSEADSDTLKLWWQAPQYHVQYRSALHSDLPTAGLPPLFRSHAISSLLPALPNPPLPYIDETILGNNEVDSEKWQSVLPGSLNYILKGDRPGAFMAIRNQIIRQQIQAPDSGQNQEPALVSSSIPVQHRVPRPVSLPNNKKGGETWALQTWASYFEPESTLCFRDTPFDEAFWIKCGDLPTMRLRLDCISPQHGELSQDWDGSFEFSWRADWVLDENEEQPRITWDFSPRLSQFPNEVHEIVDSKKKIHTGIAGTFFAKHNTPEDVVNTLQTSDLKLYIDVTFTITEKTSFQQTLSFPLKLGNVGGVNLPLVPRFIYFEDPEYNRLLASLAGKSIVNVQEFNKVEDETNKVNYAVTLATDRREYNSDSVVAFRYDWDDGKKNVPDFADKSRIASLIIQVLDPKTGTPEKVKYSLLSDPASKESRKLIPGELYFLPLEGLKLEDDTPITLAEGDRVHFKLTLEVQTSSNDDDMALSPLNHYMNIVSEPVTPRPEAGYALLRKLPSTDLESSVSCALFAWSPSPARIELICADDLQQEIVRRRAVFKWLDITRNGDYKYAIQKIAKNGSTHFPEPKLSTRAYGTETYGSGVFEGYANNSIDELNVKRG
ncbi:MAG: hypothetical protein DWQ04_06150 [Chloroflexi bacterium]|nr:MAG: hypothetical protein DWQ04_06150 [Chloroflexota bacterium]